jgi:hypothetical protein
MRSIAFGVLVGVVLVAGCKSGTEGAPSAGVAERLSVHLPEASLDDALVAYRKATGEDISMRDSTRRDSACIRFNLDMEASSAAEFSAKMDSVLVEHGFTVESRKSGKLVTLDYSQPKPCAASTDSPSSSRAYAATSRGRDCGRCNRRHREGLRQPLAGGEAPGRSCSPRCDAANSYGPFAEGPSRSAPLRDSTALHG